MEPEKAAYRAGIEACQNLAVPLRVISTPVPILPHFAEGMNQQMATLGIPHRVRALSRWYHIAKKTRIFARQLGLKPCYTPVKSSQSNGISEAFVKTLKRDHVHVTPLPDAAAVLELIGGSGWFENCNGKYPHSGLTMRSPRDSIAAQAATA